MHACLETPQARLAQRKSVQAQYRCLRGPSPLPRVPGAGSVVVRPPGDEGQGRGVRRLCTLLHGLIRDYRSWLCPWHEVMQIADSCALGCSACHRPSPCRPHCHCHAIVHHQGGGGMAMAWQWQWQWHGNGGGMAMRPTLRIYPSSMVEALGEAWWKPQRHNWLPEEDTVGHAEFGSGLLGSSSGSLCWSWPARRGSTRRVWIISSMMSQRWITSRRTSNRRLLPQVNTHCRCANL